jgi:hypothetical protein
LQFDLFVLRLPQIVIVGEDIDIGGELKRPSNADDREAVAVSVDSFPFRCY